jgi:hypothetical protein
MDDHLRLVTDEQQQPDTLAAWQEEGRLLARRLGKNMFDIGDWWLRGAPYGARQEMTQQPDWQGPSFQTCMNCASVCRRFPPTSRRREVLSFGHLEAVAALNDQEANALLDWAEEPAKAGKRPHSVRELREKREHRRVAELNEQLARRGEAAASRRALSDDPDFRSAFSAVQLGVPVKTTYFPAVPPVSVGPVREHAFPTFKVTPRTSDDFRRHLRALVQQHDDVPTAELADVLEAEAAALRQRKAN